MNAMRILVADSIEKAKSGHPGMALGSAPIMFELFTKHLRHNPKNSNWMGRDRFVLSAGHASALIYSTLHLFGYEGMTIEELKNFRQLNSKTPGHPEYGHTIGVEASTGPLGAGCAMAVGMAMAQAHLAGVFNKDGYDIFDNNIFCLAGDGCLMEGINYEAFSLAGTLKLGKLVVLYDSNNMTIEGRCDLAFEEDVQARFRALGFDTFFVEDGNDLDEIGAAIEAAKKSDKPAMVEIKTKIGALATGKEDTPSAHGEPLGEESIKALRKNANWEDEEPFFIPESVYEYYRNIKVRLEDEEARWNKLVDDYFKTYPQMQKIWDDYFNLDLSKKLLDEKYWDFADEPKATRIVSGEILNRIKEVVPNLFGGSADLGTSNKTIMEDVADFSKDNYLGRNIHFGIRELAMAGIANGVLLFGGLHPYVATFLVFADYVKPMARLASLMGLPATYILTNDSVGVGEDGPTHQPVEQVDMLRNMPNFNVIRPADARETMASWYLALTSKHTPTALVLSKQNLPQLEGSSLEALKGGYVISEAFSSEFEGVLVASGSEVSLCIEAQKVLAKENIAVRVVSMPCMDIFEQQDYNYREEVLPYKTKKVLAVEAASGNNWYKFIAARGGVVNMSGFGASAPADELFKIYGFTVENVVNNYKKIL